MRAKRSDEPCFGHLVMAPCGWLLLAWTQRHVVLALDPITGEEVVVAGQIDRSGGSDGSARSSALLDSPMYLALPHTPTTSTAPVSTTASAPAAATSSSTSASASVATAQSQSGAAPAPASARAVVYIVQRSTNTVCCCTLPQWMMQPPVGMHLLLPLAALPFFILSSLFAIYALFMRYLLSSRFCPMMMICLIVLQSRPICSHIFAAPPSPAVQVQVRLRR